LRNDFRKNHQDKTPREVAVERSQKKVAAYLEKKGFTSSQQSLKIHITPSFLGIEKGPPASSTVPAGELAHCMDMHTDTL
jgi:hypothetical protein